MLDVGFTAPLSKSMRGSTEEFRRDLAQDYTFSRYPFGDNLATSSTYGFQFAFRPASLPLAPFVGIQHTGFSVDDSLQNEVRLGLWTFSLGGEYALGDYRDRWNAFGRLAINMSLVDGALSYRNLPPLGAMSVEMESGSRIGFEGAIGARFNLQSMPLSIESSVGYTDANLSGRSFRQPSPQPPQPLDRIGINDAPDPADPADAGRTIDYVSMRLGLRLRF
jgi:hypothetical protein